MTPAATLSILVNAQTAMARAELTKLDATTKRSAAIANAATTSIGNGWSSAAQKGTVMNAVATQQKRNLDALGTAAKRASMGLGLLAGYGAYKVIKSGIQFNATMESNTLALKNLLGSAKEARKFLDQLYGTAKKTPFEFTDLTSASRRLISFGLSAEKTQRILAATGDAIAAMGGGAENIDRVTLALGQMQAKGKVSAEELLQLTEAGIPAYAILQKELGLTSDQVANIGNEGIKASTAIDALTKGMEDRFGGAARKQAKTWEGLTSTIQDTWAQMTGAMTKGLFKEMKEWGPAIIDTMDRVTAIFSNKNLDFGEKITRSLAAADRHLGPLWDRVVKELQAADIGTKILDGIEWAIPRVAENAGRLSLALAKGLARGFMQADALGKLFIGATVLRYFGGAGVIRAAGARIGTTIAAGTLTGITGLIGGGVLGGLIIDSLYPRKLDDMVRDVVTMVVDLFEKMKVGVTRSMDKVASAAFQMGHDVKITKDDFKTAAQGAEFFSDALADTQDKMAKFAAASRKMADKVGDNMTGLAKVVTQGLGVIATNTNKALEGFGVKKISLSLVGVGQAAKGFQKGGVMVPGQGDGDKVPALLEPGEVVLNKKAVAAMGGASRANSINKKIPRFASGGVVGGATGGLHPSILQFVSQLYQKYGGTVSSGVRAGDSGSLHSTGQAADYVPSNWAGAAAAANRAGSSLLEGIYNPGVHGGPAVSWDSGSKVSPSYWGSSTWGGHLDHIHLAVADGTKAAIGAAVEDIKRVMLKGPDGPLKTMGQAALDKVRNAANKFIASKMPAIGAGKMHGPIKGLPDALQKYNRVYPQSSGFGDGYAMPFNAVAALAEWAGAPGVSMARTAIGESQLEPGAVGFDPGGTRGLGLWMITTGFNDALISKLGGESSMRNPVINAQAMNTIFDSQGIGAWYSQTADSSNTHYNGPLLRQAGGIVQKFAKGGKAKDLHGSISGGKHDAAWKRFSKARRIARNLKELLGERGKVAKLDETISMTETLAGLSSSPGGSDLSPSELAKQIALNQHLLEVMVRARKMANSGMGLLNFPKGMSTTGVGKTQVKNLKGIFGSYLTDLTGVTGKGGRIFDTRVHLNELRNGSTAGAAAIDISALRSVIEASRYGAFDGMFAKGGSIRRGHWGIAGEAGPEIVHGPATVTPMGAPQVNITFADGMGWLKDFVKVEYDSREKDSHRRLRQYG